VEQIEAEVDAMAEIEDMSTKEDDIESQFAALEGSDASADILLEDLRKQMNQEGLLEDKTDSNTEESND